ncbi:rhamnogalacturonan acetylesterase [Paenibacillus filicis]|uniref:Rhamnogalacturonan acetylesterase n=1 Tax=Paenibacillus gyeongsangnamensis TaxID=3388067 RepID=A0ABT4QBM3_9BACL|nr:rhamnogalacturonan acetylesterase [Paenibacillus filicis]MCZ8514229.1 rhamnogalacturonan acetylesterase [Paenibacillus filicis]
MPEQQTLTVYIAGDSTVQTYKAESAPQAGWGQFISRYFTGNVRFINKAIGGRSSKTFVEEGRLEEILNVLQENDYLFIQMGHNDSTASKPERYTEPFGSYKTYLKMYTAGAKEWGAIPILLTPVGRLHYHEGTFLNDFSDYCAAMKQVAEEEQVQLIDLMDRSLALYRSLGYDEAAELFMISSNGTDCTHFTEKGADHIARLVMQGVKELQIPISIYVNETP